MDIARLNELTTRELDMLIYVYFKVRKGCLEPETTRRAQAVLETSKTTPDDFAKMQDVLIQQI